MKHSVTHTHIHTHTHMHTHMHTHAIRTHIHEVLVTAARVLVQRRVRPSPPRCPRRAGLYSRPCPAPPPRAPAPGHGQLHVDTGPSLWTNSPAPPEQPKSHHLVHAPLPVTPASLARPRPRPATGVDASQRRSGALTRGRESRAGWKGAGGAGAGVGRRATTSPREAARSPPLWDGQLPAGTLLPTPPGTPPPGPEA